MILYKMKRIEFIGILFLAINIIGGACSQTTSLENAFQSSGENRYELEKVLNYYRNRLPQDSLKYRAANFLIANMPGHTYYQCDDILPVLSSGNFKEKYQSMLAEILLLRFIHSHQGLLQEEEDIKNITADFLIAHIESVFKQKETCTWLRDVNFDDFCEYLLPYRLDKERITFWRDWKVRDYYRMDDYITTFDDTRTSVVNLSKKLSTILEVSWDSIVKALPAPMNQYVPDCQDKAISELMLHRICGIPAAIDMVPCWGDYDGEHVWVQPISHEIYYMDKVAVFNRTIPKVYRKAYSKQNKSCVSANDEYIPPLFLDAYLKDVTHEYVNSMPVAVQGFPRSAQYGYLCVFHRGEWKPVAQSINKSGKCIFPDMGTGILYLPVYYTKTQQHVVSEPFILRGDGGKEHISSNKDTEKVVLHRKAPLESRKSYYMKRLPKINILACDSLNHWDTIYSSEQKEIGQPIQIELGKKYYSFRIVPQSETSVELSEIYFLNQNGKRLHGAIESTAPNQNNLTDGDILTSTWMYDDGIVFSFDKKNVIHSLVLLPSNDGNGIYPKNEYELLYFDKQIWKSCGKKIAESYSLEFDNVPQKALLWLRNRTCGKEERVFIYEKGKQLFW